MHLTAAEFLRPAGLRGQRRQQVAIEGLLWQLSSWHSSSGLLSPVRFLETHPWLSRSKQHQ